MSSKISALEELVIEVRTGLVVGNQNWSQANVNVHTTTHHDAATGHGRSDTNVSSTSTEQLRLFVRDDNGSEFEIRAHNVGFGFMEGHRVSAVYLASTHDSRRSDADNLVGLINHSTSKHSLFNNSVRNRISGPVNLMQTLIALAAIVAGPIVVFKLWSALAPEYDDIFWKGIGSAAIGVFGALFLISRVSAMLEPKGPKEPSLEEAVFERLRSTIAASIEREKGRLSPAVGMAPVAE